MQYSDAPLILFLSILISLFCEAVSWVLIYRTAGYQTLRENIDRTSKQVDAMKSTLVQKTKNKKLGRREELLKNSNRELSFIKMKSTVVVGASLAIVYGLLTSFYDGVPVARLPFEPLIFMRGLCHRGLPGDDFTECSLAFLYILCSVSCRGNIQKLLGFAPPRSIASNSLFPMQPMQ